MVKRANKHIIFFIVTIVVIAFIANIASGLLTSKVNQPTPTTTQSVNSTDYFSYQGQSGKNALTLLKEKASVEQDKSGLVVSINGRKADSSKREYWAFYVNGELAPVGPADYKTKEEDKIEWKIDRY